MPTVEPGTRAHFRNLLSRIADGDRAAAGVLVEKHGDKVIRMARRRMNQAIRKKFDSEDFTQDMWATFFAHFDDSDKFANESDLASYLCRIVSNKVISEGRRGQVRAESSDDELPQVHQDQRTRQSEPTPSQYVRAREKWDAMTANQPAMVIRLLELKRDGANSEEIAEALGITARHVRRVLQRRGVETGVIENSDGE